MESVVKKDENIIKGRGWPALPPLLTIAETARILRISRTKLYTMMCNGELGVVPLRLGKRRVVSSQELLRWIDAGCPCRKKWLEQKDG